MACTLLGVLYGLYAVEGRTVCHRIRSASSGMTSRIADDRTKRTFYSANSAGYFPCLKEKPDGPSEFRTRDLSSRILRSAPHWLSTQSTASLTISAQHIHHVVYHRPHTQVMVTSASRNSHHTASIHSPVWTKTNCLQVSALTAHDPSPHNVLVTRCEKPILYKLVTKPVESYPRLKPVVHEQIFVNKCNLSKNLLVYEGTFANIFICQRKFDES